MFFLNHYFLLSFILHDVLSNFAFSNQSSHHTRSEKGIEDWPISSYLSSISWGEFIDSHVNTKNSNDYDLIAPKLDRLHLCPQSIVTNLTSKLSIIHKKWCNWAFDPKGGNVKVGESYGNLKSADIQRFEYLNCNTLLTGIDLTCDDIWGTGFLQAWKRNKVKSRLCDPKANSKINCYDSVYPSAKMCIFENAMMNFKKVRTVKRKDDNYYRVWEKGFLSADCGESALDDIGYLPMYKPDIEGNSEATCEYVFNETVIAYSHENVRNLGRSQISDFLNVWILLWLTSNSRNSKDIVLLNIDGIFKNGHFSYDRPSQYFRHYEVNFKKIIRASQFPSDSTVCFKTLIMPPKPPLPFATDSWMHDSRCSFVGPSALFQRWNLQIRKSYGLLSDKLYDRTLQTIPTRVDIHPSIHHGPYNHSSNFLHSRKTDIKALSNTDWRILLIVRSARRHSNTTRSNEKEIARLIRNQAEIIDALHKYSSRKNIDLVYYDFNRMTFESQVRLLSNVSIVIGMHGAGIASSAMHMSVGSPNCCGIIEIFPPGEFASIRGYGNMARRMGHHYTRIEIENSNQLLDSEKTSSRIVTIVSPTQVISAIEEIVNLIKYKPSCFLPAVIRSPL